MLKNIYSIRLKLKKKQYICVVMFMNNSSLKIRQA